LKSYFYRSNLNYVSNLSYLINGTKEAKILAIELRWPGHSVHDMTVFDHFEKAYNCIRVHCVIFISQLCFHSLFCTKINTSFFIVILFFVSVFLFNEKVIF